MSWTKIWGITDVIEKDKHDLFDLLQFKIHKSKFHIKYRSQFTRVSTIRKQKNRHASVRLSASQCTWFKMKIF